MSKLKDTLISIGFLGLILAVGLVLILVFGGLSIGIQWLWKQIPFGIAGFVLGAVIIAVTVFMAKQVMPERKFKFSWDFVNELGFLEVIGYLLGSVILFASLLWFITPNPVLRVLPSFGSVLAFSLIGILLFYGAASCFAVSIISWRVYILGSFFYFVCGAVGIGIVNLAIWGYTEDLPTDYYLFGKAIFAFIFLVQMLYIALFHIVPAIQQYKKEAAEELKNANKKGEPN